MARYNRSNSYGTATSESILGSSEDSVGQLKTHGAPHGEYRRLRSQPPNPPDAAILEASDRAGETIVPRFSS